MNIEQWAIKWGVSVDALWDLRRELGLINTDPEPKTGVGETAVQTQVRLEASRKGCRLWRNNVGATYTEDGSFLRYGLANDSKQMNDLVKSSDLIGIHPVPIQQRHVGSVIGQFMAREVKKSDWEYSGTKREEAQLNFLNLVLALGGNAAFVTGEGSI